MKKNTLILAVCLLLSATNLFSQGNKGSFRPATAKSVHYNALYILNESEPKKIQGILRNIGNALNDPRLKGKLHIELIAFADGVEMYKKTNPYLGLLLPLKKKGVDFVQCMRTMEERKVKKEALYDFVEYVPSGNGEIILRQYEGWAVVHP
jgi:intracellular sulfur oxidation DsrE/DsrF family protein